MPALRLTPEKDHGPAAFCAPRLQTASTRDIPPPTPVTSGAFKPLIKGRNRCHKALAEKSYSSTHTRQRPAPEFRKGRSRQVSTQTPLRSPLATCPEWTAGETPTAGDETARSTPWGSGPSSLRAVKAWGLRQQSRNYAFSANPHGPTNHKTGF